MSGQVPEPPRLPDPGVEYELRYFTQLLNVFRLYFNRLTALLQALFGTKGGTYIQTYYGQFFSAATQTAASANTAYNVEFDTVSLSAGMSMSADTVVTVDAAGVYMVTLSLQLANADTVLHRVDVWFAQNGTELPLSNSRYSVSQSHGGADGHMATEIVLFVEMAALDTLECFWSTDSTDVSLEYTGTAVSPTRPATASAIMTINLVSALPGA